jgi:integrase
MNVVGSVTNEQKAQILALVAQLLTTVGIDAKEFRAYLRDGQRRSRGITVSRLCWQYLEFADGYYLQTDGSCARESANIELALRPLRKLFGRTPVAEFGPRKLKEVREEMIKLGWCRRQVNRQVSRIKRMLKWATENEIIPASVFHAVNPVAGLRMGRTSAPDHPEIKPVLESLIEPVIGCASPQVGAMIRLQLLTGMRPGEVVIMRLIDVDTSSQPWVYRPSRHKTAHHGHERIVFVGPQAQEIMQPFIRKDDPSAYLFSPAAADEDRRRRLRENRTTPLSCGNRPGTNMKRRPRKSPGERYVTQTYGRAIVYACRRAFPEPEGLDEEQRRKWRQDHQWHPHQLRHNAATRLRKEFGLDVAQVVLGHKTLAVTQVYAERDTEAARKVMIATG